MRKLLLIALLLASPALADTYTVGDSQGNLVRLFDEPCDKTSGWLKMQKAFFRYQGKDYAACWATFKGVVLIFDDSGDITPVPMSAFKKEEVI